MTFITSEDKISNVRVHRQELATADGTKSKTTYAKKTKLTVDKEGLFIPALVAPSFKEDCIGLGKLSKHNNVLFTKDNCYLLGPSELPKEAVIIGEKDHDNLYRITTKLVNPKKYATPAAAGTTSTKLTSNDLKDERWNLVKNKKKKDISVKQAPIIKDTYLHNTLNHSAEERLN